MKVSLEVFLADIFFMSIYEKNGECWGAERKSMSLGPWHIDVTLKVQSFKFTKKECLAFATLSSRVWLYVAITPADISLHVFDGKEAGLTWGNLDKLQALFSELNAGGVVKELGVAVKSSYVFSYTSQEWKKLSPKVGMILQSIAKQPSLVTKGIAK